MISAILTAAGLSRRMGNINKLLLLWEDRPLVAHMCQILLASKIEELIVVTGHQSDAVTAVLPRDLRLKTVYNPNYVQGLTTSIQTGVRHLSPDCQAFLVIQADQPWLTSSLIDRLIDHWKISPEKSIVVPEYQGRRRTPVLFAYEWRHQIQEETYPEGCRNILKSNAQAIRRVVVNDPKELEDIDTLEGWKRLGPATRRS